MLELFLPAQALNGFDPDTNRRLGLRLSNRRLRSRRPVSRHRPRIPRGRKPEPLVDARAVRLKEAVFFSPAERDCPSAQFNVDHHVVAKNRRPDGRDYRLIAPERLYRRVELERSERRGDNTWSDWRELSIPSRPCVCSTTFPKSTTRKRRMSYGFGPLVDMLPHLKAGGLGGRRRPPIRAQARGTRCETAARCAGRRRERW